MIDGLNGASAPVVTTWITESDGPPRLTSAWVDIPESLRKSTDQWQTRPTRSSMS